MRAGSGGRAPAAGGPGVGAAEFRLLMSALPAGVTIVTTVDLDGRPWGMTCSSVCSVSLEPPVLLVCLRRGSPTLEAMLRRSTFAVNLLHERARAAAELFASGAPDRFDSVRWSVGQGAGGPYLTDDAHAVAHCEIRQAEVVGDHAVVFGAVFHTEHEPRRAETARPLLYGLRRYASWPAG
ncbi:flavin reductase family protein [Streptosporangium carneum]|uniref:Flavin reductase like domain-containing protein n=1 Tax=Streptosporangium carneum TaxID=47481 RepID=A0A9W6I618_9ACTN|nr:flavin reductase family protein [Streptosporangium carneum]GLK12348.1 hypothetical protein GCM10017600_57580 [Streptosporangium carneum]